MGAPGSRSPLVAVDGDEGVDAPLFLTSPAFSSAVAGAAGEAEVSGGVAGAGHLTAFPTSL